MCHSLQQVRPRAARRARRARWMKATTIALAPDAMGMVPGAIRRDPGRVRRDSRRARVSSTRIGSSAHDAESKPPGSEGSRRGRPARHRVGSVLHARPCGAARSGQGIARSGGAPTGSVGAPKHIRHAPRAIGRSRCAGNRAHAFRTLAARAGRTSREDSRSLSHRGIIPQKRDSSPGDSGGAPPEVDGRRNESEGGGEPRSPPASNGPEPSSAPQPSEDRVSPFGDRRSHSLRTARVIASPTSSTNHQRSVYTAHPARL